MRVKVAAVVAAVLAVVLAGCSSGAPGAGGGTGAPAEGAFPVTVPTAFGDVTIPEAPQRVVALGWSDAETALALGVEPVGAADWLAVGGDGLGPWVTERYTTPPQVLGTLEVDVEQVAALEPDLILDTRASGDPARHDQLTALGVPVVGIPAGAENYLTSWREQLNLVGAALGREDRAAELERDLEGRFATTAAQNPLFPGATFAIGSRDTVGEYGAYVTGDGRVDFLTELGLVNSPALDAIETDNFFVPVSREQMELLDARVTLMQVLSGNAAEVTNDPLWNTVPSVAAGRGIVLDDPALSNALASGSVPGQIYALENIVGPISEALTRP